MTAASSGRTPRGATAGAAAAPELSVADLVLLRIAAGGATRAELQRDLLVLLTPRMSGSAFRRAAELAIGNLTSRNAVSETKGRLQAAPAGLRAASEIVPALPSGASSWSAARTGLAALALGLAEPNAATAKACDRVDGLAALVLQNHFGLPCARALSPADLRAELAVVALERAFGNKIKTGLGKGSGLPGKAGRALAGQLFDPPRLVSSDGKLVLWLAAEVIGAKDATHEALTAALIRRLLTPDGAAPLRPPAAKKARKPAPTPDNDAQPIGLAEPATIVRPGDPPDMMEFAGAVVEAARPVSEGWPGNRKAFISLVWQAIRRTRPDWEFAEVAFKGMLVEAHRSGHIVLAGADLKDRCDLKKLEDSKILYKNTIWHFVRVED